MIPLKYLAVFVAGYSVRLVKEILVETYAANRRIDILSQTMSARADSLKGILGYES